MNKILGSSKAIIAALVAGLTSLQLAIADSSASGSTITSAEWVNIAVAVLGGFGLTWVIANKPPAP